MSFDLWFWRGQTALDPAELVQALSTSRTEPEPYAPGLGHRTFRATGPVPSGLEPFDGARVFAALEAAMPGSASADEPLLEVCLVRVPGGVLWGSASLSTRTTPRAPATVIEALTRIGCRVYDPQADVVHDPCEATRQWLTLEGLAPRADPSLEQVLEVLGEVGTLGHSFVVLEATSGDFVQARGDHRALSVEWRSHEGGTCHRVAARPGAEALDLDAARLVFTAFFRGELRPTTFEWLDITAELRSPR